MKSEFDLPMHFHIIADWGESQYFTEGDYMVIPKKGDVEIYRIGRKEFEETYVLV